MGSARDWVDRVQPGRGIHYERICLGMRLKAEVEGRITAVLRLRLAKVMVRASTRAEYWSADGPA